MGTNYYLRKIPTKERKKELCDLINSDNFEDVKKQIQNTYGNYEVIGGEPTGGVIHLGKRSGGWKFLWNPNVYVVHNGHCETKEIEPGHTSITWVEEPSTLYYTYPLTKVGIKEFIDNPCFELYDEYGEKQDKDEFFKMALEWTTWGDKEAWDSKIYEEENPRYIYPLKSELINLLKQEGFKMNSKSNSDFYSDELRFSTYTEFS